MAKPYLYPRSPMPNPILYSATDLDELGRQLARNLEKHPPTDPFLQDIILVTVRPSATG